jgi:hypothetical protein
VRRRRSSPERTRVLVATLAACAIATAIGPAHVAASGIPTATVHKPDDVAKKGRVVIFALTGVAAESAVSARLSFRRRAKAVRTTALTEAVASGRRLKTKLRRRWLPDRRRKKAARKARLKVKATSGDLGDLRIGLVANAQGWNMNSASVLDEVEPTGAQWLREEFSWEVIEPANDKWQWDRYDNLLARASERGIRILPVLMSTPSWAGSSWNQIPANPTEYAEFTAAVVARYGPGGSYWDAHPEIASYAPDHFELWNEPYLDAFSAGGVNPARYARLVKAAATAGRAANSEARFLLQADRTPGGDARHTFIDDMYAAVPDLNSHFDAVAVHPYAAKFSPDRWSGGWGFERIDAARQKFVEHGAGDKPLWVTEIGWSTCPADTDYCTSEQKQATYLGQMFELLRTRYSDYVHAVFVYQHADWGPAEPADREYWYGLKRRDGTRKPAYDVFRDVASAAAP